VTTKNESNSSLLNELPVELSPTFTTPKANDPVLIALEGELILQRDGTACFQGIGRIALEWLPRPAIRFRAKSPSADIRILLDKYQLIAKELGRPLDAQVMGGQFSNGTLYVNGFVTDDVFPHDMEISAASFSMPNFMAYLGKPVRDVTGGSCRRVRSEFEAEGWRITLDAVRDIDKDNKLLDELNASGGFGITHTGLIQRIDKSEFQVQELEDLIKDLFWFFSFCRGFKTGPLLVQLYGKDTTNRFLNLSCPIVEPWQARILWLDELGVGSLASVFPGYLKCVRTPMWAEPIKNAIHWYLNLHAQAGAIEGAIIFGQTALELLGWTALVDDRKLISAKGYKELPAADKIRVPLSTCGIPLEIPNSLLELNKTALAENWQDGAQCIAEIRNAVVHPSTKKRGKLDRVSFPAICDTWQLCIWYLELILLRLFDYNGTYANRMHSEQWKGENIQLVPWAKEDAKKPAPLPFK
jgi:hypothetical protein